MPKCRITVLKRTVNPDVAHEFCQEEVTPCENFKEGQEFVTGYAKPPKFCDWAWNDIHKYVTVMLADGNFQTFFKDWMKDDKTMIACCTDGVRPVVFKLEKIDDSVEDS